jgi:NAD+ kinase
MNTHFQTIALMSRQRHYESGIEVLKSLVKYLIKNNRAVILEEETALLLNDSARPAYAVDALGKHSDLIIVVGGDGGLLQAARAAVQYDKPILGINRGHLGFLADIHPHEIEERLDAILAGEYKEERRFLLNAVVQKPQPIHATALNDVVLLPGQVAHMIEFEIFVDEQFVCKQRADGLIVATPTGSTAYALSGGGPILHPDLDAIVLVPMFPHTLSSRPLVLSSHCNVLLHITKNTPLFPRLSCDGQAHIELSGGDYVSIQKKEEKLRLIHPLNYDYFDTLRVKLHWR